MWKNNSWCLYFSIQVFFIFLLSGFFGDQLWPPKQSWAIHSSNWSFWSFWKKGIYSIMYCGWILILGGLAFCARSWLSFFFSFSIGRIFRTHHITSNVQNWIDLKRFVSNCKIKQSKTTCCLWIETNGKLTSAINCKQMPLNPLMQIQLCMIL